MYVKKSEYSNISVQLANDDGTVTYDEIRNQLKKWEDIGQKSSQKRKEILIHTSDRVDFSDVEIDVFFGLSDVNGDGTISTDVSSSFTVLKRGGAVYVFYLSPNSTAGE